MLCTIGLYIVMSTDARILTDFYVSWLSGYVMYCIVTMLPSGAKYSKVIHYVRNLMIPMSVPLYFTAVDMTTALH